MRVFSVISVALKFTDSFAGLKMFSLTVKLIIFLTPETKAGLMANVCLGLGFRGGGWCREARLQSQLVKRPKKKKKPRTHHCAQACQRLSVFFQGLGKKKDRTEDSEDWHANVHNNCPTLLQFLFITSYSLQYQLIPSRLLLLLKRGPLGNV